MINDLDPAECARAAPAAASGQLGLRRVRRRGPRVRRARPARHLSLPRRTVMTAELLWSRPDLPADVATRARTGHRGQPVRLPSRRHRADDHEVSAGRSRPAQRRGDVRGPGRELASRPLRLSRDPARQRPAARLTGRRGAAATGRRHSPARDLRRGAAGALRLAGRRARDPGQHHAALRRRPRHPDQQRGRHPAAAGRRTSGLPVLDRALDVSSIRRGMVGDPTDPETSTPPVQYYFYDACRVQPSGSDELRGVAGGGEVRRAPRSGAGHVLGAVGQPIPGLRAGRS